jgi:hypothetical protein
MKVVKNKKSSFAKSQILETLEERRLMATAPWGNWPVFLGMDRVVQDYPWLNGGGRGVAVIDKGIDYLHPALGGNPANGTKSPRIVNVRDYRDNDNDPFPSESEQVDPSSAHGTGVAGILAALPYDSGGRHYQGILQNSLLYNLRTNRTNSTTAQDTIKQSLQWILDNRTKYNITAINLTDFIGTGASTPVYEAQIKALWDAGVFVATPVANDWLGTTGQNAIPPKQPIGLPAKSPWIYGTGGVLLNGQIRPQTQRGPGLDILGPSQAVSIPYYTPSTGEHVYLNNAATGNSWGTPHIVGTAVLIQQIDPTITPAEIFSILKDSGMPVVDPDGTGTYPALNMYAAIQLAYSRRDDAFDQSGGNDSLANAKQINLNGDGDGSAAGLKLLAHDDDYYKFTVGNAANYELTIDGASGELLDANGNVVAQVGSGGLTRQLAAGTYYLHLYNDNALNGTYSIDVDRLQITQPPPNPGVDGRFNDLKYDASNNLNFAWFDDATKTLKYAKRTGNVWSTTQIVDGNNGAGEFVSMAVDSTGKPGLAYYDSANGDLKYAHFNGSTWDVETVDSTNTVGYYPSIRFGAGDRPAIAYYAKTGGDLKLATFNGSTWSTTAIDTKGDVGRYPSLALNPATGRWAVAYEATGAGAFKYAQQTKAGWSVAVVDDTVGIAGGFTSLAFDANNLPAFSYYAARDANLKFARFDGSRWNLSTVASKNSVGLYTNLFFDGGNPVIYYFNKTGNSLVAARSDGNVWDYETLVTGGGRESKVALDGDGFETYSWLDGATGDVKVGAA